MIFLSSDFFFKLFQKILSGILLECQTVWIQIRPGIVLALIWVQTVCKDQQQKTKFATGRQRDNLQKGQNKQSTSKSVCPWRNSLIRRCSSLFCQAVFLTLYLPVSSADYLYKQFGPRSGHTKCLAWSGSKLFDTMIFLNYFFKS